MSDKRGGETNRAHCVPCSFFRAHGRALLRDGLTAAHESPRHRIACHASGAECAECAASMGEGYALESYVMSFGFDAWATWIADDGPDTPSAEWCPVCRQELGAGPQVVVTVDLDPGCMETGPQPNLADIPVHQHCHERL